MQISAFGRGKSLLCYKSGCKKEEISRYFLFSESAIKFVVFAIVCWECDTMCGWFMICQLGVDIWAYSVGSRYLGVFSW